MTHKNRWQSRAIDRTGRRLGQDGVEAPGRYRRRLARWMLAQTEVEAEDIETREQQGLTVR